MKSKSKFKRIVGFAALSIVVVLIGILGYVKFFLPDVGAAPYLTIPGTPEQIERGKYLAHHVAVCMDCHSTRDWSRFSGPLTPHTLGKGGEYFGPEMGFPGKFYARNLTPTNLGDWSDGEIFRAITMGVDKEGKALFPVMPYKNYSKMAEEDIHAIIAYLRTLPPIEDEVPPSEADFPMNFIINTLPVKASPTPVPDPSDRIAYGNYLVNAAGCIDCHTQVNKGQIIPELAFAGGREFVMPSGVLRSPNITPDAATGIGDWNVSSFVKRFKAYSDESSLATVKPGEYNSIMPWSMYAGMKDSDLEAIYAYLQSLDPIENKVVTFSGK